MIMTKPEISRTNEADMSCDEAKSALYQIKAQMQAIESIEPDLWQQCLEFQERKGHRPLGYNSLESCLEKSGVSRPRFYQYCKAAAIRHAATIRNAPTARYIDGILPHGSPGQRVRRHLLP